MSISRLLALLVWISTVSLSPAADDADVSTDQLLRDAETVLKLLRSGDSVSAGKQAGTVFSAAARMHKEGEKARSLSLYENALRMAPWTVEHYLGYADTLQSLDQGAKATRWARSALQRAEDVETREKARVWLKEKEPAKLPFFNGRPEGKMVCLVIIGEPPEWLVHRCGIGLQNVLGIPVVLLEEKIPLPEPNRSAFRRWAAQLRNGLRWNDPGLQQFMRAKGLTTGDLSDKQVVDLVESIVRESRPAEELEAFQKNKRQLSESKYDQQWDVSALLGHVDHHARKAPDARVIWLGITSVDLYMNDSNFVFGAAQGPPACAVNSCARFKADFNGEPPDADRLSNRLLKQMLSSVGTLLEAPRPIDPTCPRSYPQSLAEQDAKTLNLCDDCRSAIAETIRKPVPPLPEKVFERVETAGVEAK
ncbi:MAG: hypothetical protein ACO1TE_05250 [Prosthecobacter sp.]